MEPVESPTILVIDDEKSLLRLLRQRLQRWGYRVLTAESGRQGVEILAGERPDVVITDLFMPEMDGFALLAHLQRTAPDLPVIVLSGQGALRDAIETLRLGAWDSIYKPIEDADFLWSATCGGSSFRTWRAWRS